MRLPLMWGHRGRFVMGGGLLLAVGSVLAVACTRTLAVQTSAPGILTPSAGGAVGASSGRDGVAGFLAGAKAQDLARMAALWGTARGPAREQLQADEVEKRLIVLQCLLNHDSWRFVEDRARLSSGGRQDWLVEVRREGRTAETLFTAVQAVSGRWFVEDLQVAPLQEFCR